MRLISKEVAISCVAPVRLDEAVFVENYIVLVVRKIYICEGLRAFWNGWRVEIWLCVYSPLFSSAVGARVFFPVNKYEVGNYFLFVQRRKKKNGKMIIFFFVRPHIVKRAPMERYDLINKTVCNCCIIFIFYMYTHL